MSKKYSQSRRAGFVKALMAVDQHWSNTFDHELFYDLNYYDLFTRMWLYRGNGLRKTELYAFVPHVSHRTAVKYVQQAIDLGYLMEKPDRMDKRAKTVVIAPKVMRRIEKFIDHSIAEFGDLYR